jgi:hypothetical protein
MNTSPRTSSTGGACAEQAQRDAPHRADVLRHVLAGFAVAARRRLHQHAALVAQVDGEAIELELGRVVHGGIGSPSSSSRLHAGVEGARAGRLGVGLGADRKHRHGVAHRGESGQGLAADALRRRIGAESAGCSASSACSSRNRRSNSASGMVGASST